MNLIEPVAKRMAENPDSEHWLHCSSCMRFFPLSRSPLGSSGERRCPFDDCYDYGLDLGLHYWDAELEPKDPRWPKSPAELRFGMRSPEMDVFYEGELRKRIEAMVSAYEQATGEKTLYLASFFKMASDLCWDVTDTEYDSGFTSESAHIIMDQLPVWSQCSDVEQAPVMLAELQRYFSFACKTKSVVDADKWLEYLKNERLVEAFEWTMRNDPRLQKAKAKPARCGRKKKGTSGRKKRRQKGRARRRRTRR